MVISGLTTGMDRNTRVSFPELEEHFTELDLAGTAYRLNVVVVGAQY